VAKCLLIDFVYFTVVQRVPASFSWSDHLSFYLPTHLLLVYNYRKIQGLLSVSLSLCPVMVLVKCPPFSCDAVEYGQLIPSMCFWPYQLLPRGAEKVWP